MFSLVKNARNVLPFTQTELATVSRCPIEVSVGGVRYATKNKIGRAYNKKRGIEKEEGTYVTKGSILVRQLGLMYHPGLNVGFGRNLNLFAMEHGTVIKTTEKCNPNWDHPIIARFYGEYENRPDIPLYKTYFHIIPDPMPQVFKLVDQV